MSCIWIINTSMIKWFDMRFKIVNFMFTTTGVKTYKPGKWNKVRVECRGDSIKTWLNDVPRANFKDTLTAKGFIGLQVHGIGGKKDLVGAQVRWRNLVLKELK